jgi:uncharacterized membrane protein
MAEAQKSVRSRWWPIFASRPRLMVGLATGVVVGAALFVIAPAWPAATTIIVAWDVACLVFLLSIWSIMASGPDDIRVHAAEQDEGRGAILSLVVVAAAASIWAIGVQLSLAKPEHGLMRTGHVALAFATVVLSWMMVQVIFALHYAHEYYDVNDECAGHDMKGLSFPGGEFPDYWDFVHFSIVIGVAAQTADVAFTSKHLRRIGTVHSLIAFAFNTVVVALTINLLAGLL